MAKFTRANPPKLDYEPNGVHRDPSRRNHHTQWSGDIDESTEFNIFDHSVAKAWGARDTDYWGVRVEDNKLEVLNNPALHDGKRAVWARFVSETTPEVWHGFPLWPDDRRPIPPQALLLEWAAHRPLSRAKAMKILRRGKCEL